MKFKKDDIVYNTQHKSVGVVLDVFITDGVVRTDADGVVEEACLLPIYRIAPSTMKILLNKER